jgi:hypothetical protein
METDAKVQRPRREKKLSLSARIKEIFSGNAKRIQVLESENADLKTLLEDANSELMAAEKVIEAYEKS